jgi:prepilin-type N-terminal cleavage/methylation domain-containing protein
MTAKRIAEPPASKDAGFTLVELLIALVVMALVMSAMVDIVAQVSGRYEPQRLRMDARQEARMALDMMGRLARMANTVTPDPDGNGLLDSVRLRGDWNPPNGAVNAYEDVLFSRAGNTITALEPTDPTALPIATAIANMTFVYRDRNYVVLANPIATWNQIASIEITLTTVPFRDGPGVTLRSAFSVRTRE